MGRRRYGPRRDSPYRRLSEQPRELVAVPWPGGKAGNRGQQSRCNCNRERKRDIMSALRPFVPSLLILLVLPAAAGAATPIAAARDLPLGTAVTIEGRVTVPSGLFA